MPLRSGSLQYGTLEASRESGLRCEDPSLAIQSQAKEADINEIVKAFRVTGLIPQNVERIQLDMFADVVDYHSAMNLIRAAEQSFMAMSAQVRAEFGNDPGRFVEFCSDEANLPRMRELGLAVPRDESLPSQPEDLVPVPGPAPVPQGTT